MVRAWTIGLLLVTWCSCVGDAQRRLKQNWDEDTPGSSPNNPFGSNVRPGQGNRNFDKLINNRGQRGPGADRNKTRSPPAFSNRDGNSVNDQGLKPRFSKDLLSCSGSALRVGEPEPANPAAPAQSEPLLPPVFVNQNASINVEKGTTTTVPVTTTTSKATTTAKKPEATTTTVPTTTRTAAKTTTTTTADPFTNIPLFSFFYPMLQEFMDTYFATTTIPLLPEVAEHSEEDIDDGKEERLPPGFVAAAAPSEFKSSSTDCSCNEYYNALKNECECKPGYSKYYNQTCLPNCDPSRVRSGDRCVCAPEFDEVDGICRPKCGCNMHRAPGTNTCICDNGYDILANGTCVVACAPNRVRNTAAECVCKPDFKENAFGQCVPACGTFSSWVDFVCRCDPFYVRVDAHNCKQPNCNGGHFVPGTGCVCPGATDRYDAPTDTCIATHPPCLAFTTGLWRDNRCECKPFYVPDGVDRCKEPVCGTNSVFKPEQGCTCKPGYGNPSDPLSNAFVCIRSCWNNSHAVGDNCVCDYYYFPQGNGCVTFTCDSGQRLKNGECACNAGFEYDPILRNCRPTCIKSTWNLASMKCDCLPYYVQLTNYACGPMSCGPYGNFSDAAGCQCYFGYEWSATTKRCEPPINCTHGTYFDNYGCYCYPSHTKDTDNKCTVPVCKPPAVWSDTRGGCVCTGETVIYDGQCVACGLTQTWTPTGCVCKSGLELRTLFECIEIACANGYYDKSLGKCKCNNFFGYDAAGKCTQLLCPVNSQRTLDHMSCFCMSPFIMSAANECVACGNGTTWTSSLGCQCNPQYNRIDAYQCQPPNCPVLKPNSHFEENRGCVCDSGFVQGMDGVCRRECGLNAQPTPTGCVCKAYYFDKNNNGVCEPFTCTNGLWTSTGCQCNPDFVLDGTGRNCISKCIINAHFDGQNCVCNQYFDKNAAGDCVPYPCNNGNWTNTGCSCNADYTRDSTERNCIKTCPQNQQLIGNDCKCNPYYSQFNTTSPCVRIPCEFGNWTENGCVCNAGYVVAETRTYCRPDCINSVWNISTAVCDCKPFYLRESNWICAKPDCTFGTFTDLRGCECNDGYVMNPQQKRCEPRCSPFMQWNGTACTCPPGLEAANSTYCQKIECVHGTYNQLERRCKCDDGYLRDDATGKCTIPVCTAPATWVNGGCVCPAESVYYLNQCQKCGDHAHWSVNKCVCDAGSEISSPIACCEFALDFSYLRSTDVQQNKCVCDPPFFGYDGQAKCTVLTCPANSSPVAGNTTCVCNQQYVMDKYHCVKCGNYTEWSATDGCLCLTSSYERVDPFNCKFPTCTINKRFDETIGRCVCVDGYELDVAKNECRRKCVFGTWSVSECMCDVGYEKNPADIYTCKLIDCGYGKYNTVSKVCDCDPPYKYDAYQKCTGIPEMPCSELRVECLTGSCQCNQKLVWSSDAHTACVSCGKNTIWGSTGCQCLPNYVPIDPFSCRPPTCPTNGAFNVTGSACYCLPGYEWNTAKTECIPTCLNGVWGGSECVCNNGYEPDVGYACKPINCVNGGEYNLVTRACVCTPAFLLDTLGRCTIPACTPVSKWNATTGRCECIGGYVENNLQQCVLACNPPSSLYNPAKNQCECGNGYVENEQKRCVLACNPPASLYNSASNKCECANGYIENEQKVCVPNCVNGTWGADNVCHCFNGYKVDATGKCTGESKKGVTLPKECTFPWSSSLPLVRILVDRSRLFIQFFVQIPVSTCPPTAYHDGTTCICPPPSKYNGVDHCKCPWEGMESMDGFNCVCIPGYVFQTTPTSCIPKENCTNPTDIYDPVKKICYNCPVQAILLASGTCQDCPAGQIPDPTRRQCIPSSCKPTEYVNVDGKCATCPKNQDRIGNTCQCSAAYTEYNYKEGTCEYCPDGYIRNLSTKQCEICPGNAPQSDHQNNKCVGSNPSCRDTDFINSYGTCQACQPGTVPNPAKNGCVSPSTPCNLPGQYLDKKGVCITCGPTEIVLGGIACKDCAPLLVPNATRTGCVTPTLPCVGDGKYLDATGKCQRKLILLFSKIQTNIISECLPNSVPNGVSCLQCVNGQIADYKLNQCVAVVVAPISNATFENIPSKGIPCYFDVRDNGLFTTNGLCYRKGIDLCTTCNTTLCLSGLVFHTERCVANELLYADKGVLSARGKYSSSKDCGSHLTLDGKCVTNAYNVSIHTGLWSYQVVYFPADGRPVFIGSCYTTKGAWDWGRKDVQRAYCSTPPEYPFLAFTCHHSRNNIGWAKVYEDDDKFVNEQCVSNNWKVASTSNCPNFHTIEVSGSGGYGCFGYVIGAIAWHDNNAHESEQYWVKRTGLFAWEGTRLPDRDHLVLPRVIIAPGEWLPERAANRPKRPSGV
ncbi:hypothetical protein PRIPAC_83659 [Pristionchus pacificus]|uniref:Uncharacterized protein n=1 Tax=Pristionchus pacificus TaxID=54126 RepID=A0A2A6BUE7_PRIPA|nr:hypothetical protein PRIPAC_83659 [Pristionchus pacificus]|eukprot:PDM69529.1 hypothetical protein PRIPAC_44625 [Pristionchus pacificus]